MADQKPLVIAASGQIGQIQAGDTLALGSPGTGNNEYVYETLGVELAPAIAVANWTAGANITINDGAHTATFTAGAGTLTPTSPQTFGTSTKYKVTFTISSWTAGTITFTLGGVTSTPLAGNQSVSIYVEPYTTADITFTPDASFAGVISAYSNKVVTNGNLTVENDITAYGSRGHSVSMARFIRHTSEMWTNTLLDRSRSSLSCTGGVLTYTIYAVYGKGKFDFNGVIWPTVMDSVSVTLTGGTDAAPRVNFVYCKLVGNTPTFSVQLDTRPTSSTTAPIIDVAVFIVGAVSGSSYTIYGYNRDREEIDSFVSHTIERLQSSGTLYDSGFAQTVTSTVFSIASGGIFFNGIFKMTSANTVAASTGFYWVDGAGGYHYSTALSDLVEYGDAGRTEVKSKEYQNIVWGVVPTTTTASGTVPTTVKMFAILQSTATAYTSATTSAQDLNDATTYFPANSELKKVFVPIARTILKPSTPAFGTFPNNGYYQDLRGSVTSGGAAPSPSTQVYYHKSFAITNPTAASDSPLWRAPINLTITAIHVLCIGGTNIIGNLWLYDANGLNGSSVDTADITATTQTNANDSGSLSNPNVTSGNYVGWKTTSVSGTPTRAIISFEYTI
jgi:hypothetical protein